MPSRGPFLGAHVSMAGGLLQAAQRAQQLGCSSLQIFAANPRGWQRHEVGEADGRLFQIACRKAGISAVVIHAIYLVNLASEKGDLFEKSCAAVEADLRAAQAIGAQGVVVHPGSNPDPEAGRKQLRLALQRLAPWIPAGVRLLLENMAGMKNSMGSLEELSQLLSPYGPELGICLDTAHLCGYGYALDTLTGWRNLLADLERLDLVKRVGCIHVNDSKAECGTRRDRHENLLEGHVGREGFIRMLNHAPFRQLPMILETPGFDQQGPDALNMERLAGLLKRKA